MNLRTRTLATAAVLLAAVKTGAAQIGSVTAWGVEVMPLVDPGARFVGMAGGYWHSMAIQSGGTLIVWGLNLYGECNLPGGLAAVAAVAGGWEHTVAVKTD